MKWHVLLCLNRWNYVTNSMTFYEQTITREQFLEKIKKRSGSENSKQGANTSLQNFEYFCQKAYKKPIEAVIEDLIKYEKKDGNQNRAFRVLDNWVTFLQEDHPDIVINRSLPHQKPRILIKKMPTSIRTYFQYVRKYMRLRGLKLDRDDLSEFVTVPVVEEELDPEPFTHEEIRLVLSYATPVRRLLYMVLKDSGMRIGEACAIQKKHVDFDKDPVEINIPAKLTKKSKARTTYVTRESGPDLKRHLSNKEESERVFGNNPRLKSAVENEEHYFRDLRVKLSKINPVFAERYEYNRRFKKNIHSLRAFTSTQADEVHGESYAHGLIGHKKYLPQYIRNKKKLPGMYKMLEPKLLIYEKIEVIDKEETIQQMQAKLNELAFQILELQKNTEPKKKVLIP